MSAACWLTKNTQCSFLPYKKYSGIIAHVWRWNCMLIYLLFSSPRMKANNILWECSFAITESYSSVTLLQCVIYGLYVLENLKVEIFKLFASRSSYSKFDWLSILIFPYTAGGEFKTLSVTSLFALVSHESKLSFLIGLGNT